MKIVGKKLMNKVKAAEASTPVHGKSAKEVQLVCATFAADEKWMPGHSLQSKQIKERFMNLLTAFVLCCLRIFMF